MLGMTELSQHFMKRKVIDKMDDFLCTMTCEEFYSSDDCLTEEEKRAILDEIAEEENQTEEGK